MRRAGVVQRGAGESPEVTKVASREPKIAPKEPKMAPRGPKMAPKDLRMVSRDVSDGPKGGPKCTKHEDIEI